MRVSQFFVAFLLKREGVKAGDSDFLFLIDKDIFRLYISKSLFS
jgi:hypothetical protein